MNDTNSRCAYGVWSWYILGRVSAGSTKKCLTSRWSNISSLSITIQTLFALRSVQKHQKHQKNAGYRAWSHMFGTVKGAVESQRGMGFSTLIPLVIITMTFHELSHSSCMKYPIKSVYSHYYSNISNWYSTGTFPWPYSTNFPQVYSRGTGMIFDQVTCWNVAGNGAFFYGRLGSAAAPATRCETRAWWLESIAWVYHPKR